MKSRLWLLLGFGFALSLVSCGQGVDPISALGDPSQPTLGQSLGLPVGSTSGPLLNYLNPYSSARDGFDLGVSVVIGTTVLIKAPANGLVTGVDSAGTITIFHNSHLTSRVSVSNLSSAVIAPSVQPGNYVVAGSQIGVLTSGSVIHFSIIADGAYVCPLSYLSSSARGQLQVLSTTINPCLQ